MHLLNNFPRLNSNRFILKEIEDSDYEHIYDILSDKEVIKYDTFDMFEDYTQAKRLIEIFHKNFEERSAIFWGIYMKTSMKLIGFCKLEIEIPRVRADLGYNLNRQYWNKGVMTEALEQVIKFAFETLELNRIEAAVEVNNIASIKVLKKNNFTEEGILRQRSYFHKNYHDMMMLSILKNDYERE